MTNEMMEKLENCMKQTERKIKDLNDGIAKNRKGLIDELRRLADSLEADENRSVYNSDIGWINTHVKRIEEAEAEIKTLHEQQIMLRYIAEDK